MGKVELPFDKCTLGMQELPRDNHKIFTVFPCFWDRGHQPSIVNRPHTKGGTRGDPRRHKWHTRQGKVGGLGRTRGEMRSCKEEKSEVPIENGQDIWASSTPKEVHKRAASNEGRKNIPGPSYFTPKWEGPCIVKEPYNSEYYYLTNMNGNSLANPINGKWLKQYYAWSSRYPKHLLSSSILPSTSIILYFIRHYHLISLVICLFCYVLYSVPLLQCEKTTP